MLFRKPHKGRVVADSGVRLRGIQAYAFIDLWIEAMGDQRGAELAPNRINS